MPKCRFTCTLSTKRHLTQIHPETKQPVSAFVHDAELSVTPNCEENKEMFVGTHGGALKFVACAQPFEAGTDYYLEITPAPAATPPKPA